MSSVSIELKTVYSAGTHVWIPFYATQRDPRNFAPDPDSFRPERWLQPEKEEAFNKGAYVAFSTGPFSCAVS